MGATKQSSRAAATILGGLVATLMAVPAIAQDFQIFDRLSVALEGSWAGAGTTIRVDSKELGRGTELDLESDLKLGKSKTVPSLSAEWRPWERHRFGLFWKDLDRTSTSQALTEIRFEDLVIPVNADVRLGFDITEYGLAYTYILRPRERSSFGFGGGLRVLELQASISARLAGQTNELVGTGEAQVTGPLPFLGAEFRYMFSEKWRLQTDIGLFYIKIGDVTGGQGLLRGAIEHLTFEHVGFGFGFDASKVKIKSESDDWKGEANLGLYSARLFVRFRM